MPNKRSIILRISDDGVFLNPHLRIPLTNTNIPFASLSFSNSSNIFWEVDMISFLKETSELTLKVIDYQSENEVLFANQMPKYEILSICFLPFNWNAFQSNLTWYKKSELKEIIIINKEKEDPEHIIEVGIFELKFSIPFYALSFELASVSFSKNYKWNKGSNIFKIPLKSSLPEYEYIKKYFHKIIGKKSIEIEMLIHSSVEETTVKSIYSKDLEKIDEESVYVLKTQRYKEWTEKRPRLEAIDRHLYEFKELFDKYEDELFGNIDNLEKEFLFSILEDEDIRNKDQLEFLSNNVHEASEKLLMSLYPQFGFVFFYNGKEMDHYIWELLNSHATYIWSIPKTNFDKGASMIENEIGIINDVGRSQYKSHFSNSESLFFNAVFHKNRNMSYESYFPKWKNKVVSLLI